MTPTITAIYAALLAFLFCGLSLRVIFHRKANAIAFGDADDPELRRRIRSHGNFAEYVPLALVLLALAEIQGLPAAPLHLLGLALLAGRVLHAAALSGARHAGRLRFVAMCLTIPVIFLIALANLTLALT